MRDDQGTMEGSAWWDIKKMILIREMGRLLEIWAEKFIGELLKKGGKMALSKCCGAELITFAELTNTEEETEEDIGTPILWCSKCEQPEDLEDDR